MSFALIVSAFLLIESGCHYQKSFDAVAEEGPHAGVPHLIAALVFTAVGLWGLTTL